MKIINKITMNGILSNKFLCNIEYFSGVSSLLNWFNRQSILDRAVREYTIYQIENELIRVLKESKRTSVPGFTVNGENHICVLLYLLYYRMIAPMSDDFYNDIIRPVMKWENGYYNSLNMLNYFINERQEKK